MESFYTKGIPFGFQQYNANRSNTEQNPNLSRAVFGLLPLFFHKHLDLKIPTINETFILCFILLI